MDVKINKKSIYSYFLSLKSDVFIHIGIKSNYTVFVRSRLFLIEFFDMINLPRAYIILSMDKSNYKSSKESVDMKKISTKTFITLLENKEEHFAVIINHWFYYIEKGRIYRFQQHSNAKILTTLGLFYEGEIDNEQMITELKKSIINQIQYDWFTDVWKETIIERISRSPYDLETFFF